MKIATVWFLLVVGYLLVIGCGDENDDVAGEGIWDVPGYSERTDRLDLSPEETQAEIVRLVGEGHVMYMRLEIMNAGGVYSVFPQDDGTDLGCGIPQFGNPKPISVCENYPERIVRELWQALDSAGIIRTVFGKESTVDGELLATGSYGKWTDLESGEAWEGGMSAARSPEALAEWMKVSIERVYERNEELIEGEILGRASVIVAEGVFEYQLANPQITRTTRWQERDDGTTYMLSEGKVVAFAVLPPGSLPEAAHSSE